MNLNEQVHRIKTLLFELSPQSAGVEEFISQVQSMPELVKHLKFYNMNDLLEFIGDASYGEFDDLRKEVDYFIKRRRKYFADEMTEFERVANELRENEGIQVTAEDILNSFLNSSEQTLTNDIWNKLENTESFRIKKGDIASVIDLAKKYGKTNPKDIKKWILSGDYRRPLILKFGDRYHLVAGNTRLSTAKAVGVQPQVLIGNLKTI